jgi:hypothetical protein
MTLDPRLPVVLPNGQTPQDFEKHVRKVRTTVGEGNFMCGKSVCAHAAQLVAGAATDSEGNLIPLKDAGRRLVSLLRDTRKTAMGDPLGVLVTAEIELLGLRDEEILLRWQIWDDQGRLFGDWLGTNVAYRMTASTEDDATSQDFWVPLPKGKTGRLHVRVFLTADGTILASSESRKFT